MGSAKMASRGGGLRASLAIFQLPITLHLYSPPAAIGLRSHLRAVKHVLYEDRLVDNQAAIARPSVPRDTLGSNVRGGER
jgi:hypothetical protein